MTRRNVVNRLAPSDAAASSTSRSSSSSTGCTVRTTNGSVTNRNARNTAERVLATSTPERAVVAVEGEQHQAGDDRGQRERDVDQDLEHRLPQNRSRTSTQAISVPITTLTAVTTQSGADGEPDGGRGLLVGDASTRRPPSRPRRR